MNAMTLPAKSCSILLCALLLLAAGCKKDEPETLKSNKSQPAWTELADYDYTSSMTAVVKVDLAAQFPDLTSDFKITDQDRLAAFSADKCLGVATPEDGLFYLFMVGADGSVTLRYYSAHYKNIFIANNAFAFQNDSHLGTVSQPFIPTFAVEK